eukprot:1274955-Rhodomonas_salina.2
MSGNSGARVTCRHNPERVTSRSKELQVCICYATSYAITYAFCTPCPVRTGSTTYFLGDVRD